MSCWIWLVEHVRGLPVLLIVTFRPEFKPPWTGQAQVTMLALNRLDRRERIALVAQVAGKALPDSVFGADRRSHRRRAAVCRGNNQKRGGERAAACRGGPLRAGRSAAAGGDTDQSVRLAAGAAGPPAVGAAGGAGSARRSDASFPMGCCARSRACRTRCCKLRWGGWWRPSWCSSVACRRTRSTASSTRWCRMSAYGSLLREGRQHLHAGIADALEAQSPELMEAHPELFA